MELTMLPPEKEIEVKPLDDERAAVFVFTEMTQVSRSRPAHWVAELSLPLEQSLELINSLHVLSYHQNQSQMRTGRRKRQPAVVSRSLPCQSLTSSLFPHRKSEKGSTTVHITWQLRQETLLLPTCTSNRCIATPPHRRPPRTSPRRAEHRRSLTLPNAGLCEKNATSLQVRPAESRRIRNADRWVLSLAPVPCSHHPNRPPHSDESRSVEGMTDSSLFFPTRF